MILQLETKIVFHDEESEDPDWKVRQCYLLIIAAATEPFTSIGNLWKTGKSKGRYRYGSFSLFPDPNRIPSVPIIGAQKLVLREAQHVYA